MNKILLKRLFYVGVAHQLCLSSVSAQVIRSGFDNNFLAANDDGSTGLVDLGFTIDFFGNQFSSAYLNNNGNITFDQALSSFTPSGVELPTTAIIAPYFADVDTTGPGSGLLTYGAGTVDGNIAFGVNWLNVGYFSSHTDLLNSFQLILVDRSDIQAGAFDIEFNYGQIQWESGDANIGSTGGLGGETARVGYSNGNGSDFEELAGSSTPGALLDGGSDELIGLTNADGDGRFDAFVRDGEIVLIDPDGMVFGITGAEVSTLRDGINQFTDFETRDINSRLFRHRSAKALNAFDLGSESMNNNIEVFGSFNAYETTIDARVLPNLGGFIATSVPKSELSGSTANTGIEYTFATGWTAGAAALFSSADLNHKDSSFNSDLDSQGGAIYVSHSSLATESKMGHYVDVLVARSSGDITFSRNIFDVERTLTQTDFDSTELQINGGLVFKNSLLSHGPFGQLKIKSGTIDSYTENTANFGSASSPEIDIDSTKFQIGYKASAQLGDFIPQVRVGYETELDDQDSTIGTLQLAAPPEHALILGAGISYDMSSGMYIALDYEHRRYDEGVTANSINIGGGISF